jgi:hypothetical protein
MKPQTSRKTVNLGGTDCLKATHSEAWNPCISERRVAMYLLLPLSTRCTPALILDKS